MSYIVLTRFADLQDGNRIYEAGETYPRPGLDVSPERLAELAGSDNRMGEPLIVNVDAPCDKCAVEAPQDGPKEMPAESVEPPKKARRSRQKG